MSSGPPGPMFYLIYMYIGNRPGCQGVLCSVLMYSLFQYFALYDIVVHL